MFVDDEEDIVKIHRQMLEYLDYDMFFVWVDVGALRIFRENKETIGLAITDQTIPKPAGLKTAEEMHEPID